MANTQEDNKHTQHPAETFRQTSERTAEQATRAAGQISEQTRRMGLAAAKAGDDINQTGAKLLQQNVQIVQNVWRSSAEAATAIMGRATDHFGRTWGLTGKEAQEANEKSLRNAQTLLDSTTAVTQGMNEISREYFHYARGQMERHIDRLNELWRCRTAHEFAALQSDIVREAATSALENSRHLAEISLRVAEDAGKRITENVKAT
jgi:phasin family protein